MSWRIAIQEPENKTEYVGLLPQTEDILTLVDNVAEALVLDWNEALSAADQLTKQFSKIGLLVLEECAASEIHTQLYYDDKHVLLKSS